MTIKSVLCAVDVANKGKDTGVLREAARLAGLDDAQLDIVTVIPDLGMTVVGTLFEGDHHDKAEAEAKRLLEEMGEEVLGKEANSRVRHVVATGRPYEQILRAAEAAGANLIVLGSHEPDLHDFLLGPNASRVVRHAKCSVYVVR